MIGSIRKFGLPMALFGAALAVSTLISAPAVADNGLVVRDFVLTNAIVGREPTNQANSFTVHDEKAFAFARINNTGTPTTVNVVWHYEGTQHGSVWLNVGTSPGNWSVRLIDAGGSVLVQRSFIVGQIVDTMMTAYEDFIVEEPTSISAVTTDDQDGWMF